MYNTSITSKKTAKIQGMNIYRRAQQRLWALLYPIFPRIEHKLVYFHTRARQPFEVGWLAPGHSLADMKKHLAEKWGFGNHFVAWEDSSQVLSWRKLTSFKEQYHLRVYSDGEIRGHYEYTPEAAPIRHFFGKGEARTRDLLNFLGEYVTTEKHVSVVVPDTSVASQDSEITFSEGK